ncbi:MAG: hypothetical protein AB2A00_01070 [Myxococcota bacterium]
MASEDELKQNALSSMLVAIRATPLAAKVDANQALFAMSNSWKKVFSDGTLDLQPLYAYLLSQNGVTPNDAATVCLLLHKRQEKLGLPVKLPKMVETLPAGFRQELLNTLPKNTGLTQPGAPLRAPTGVVKPPEPAPKPADKVPPKPVSLPGAKKVSGVTILLAVVAGIVATVISIPSPPRKVARADLALPPECAGWEIAREEFSYMLFVPEKEWSRPRSEIDEIAKKVMERAKAQKGQRVMLCKVDDAACAVPQAVVRRDGVVTWTEFTDRRK